MLPLPLINPLAAIAASMQAVGAHVHLWVFVSLVSLSLSCVFFGVLLCVDGC